MLISTEWIKDFTPMPEGLSPKEVGEKFTLGTAEVEDVLTVGEHLEVIRVAEILEIEKHPEADKLNLVTFNFGGKENKRVVCGAANVRVGLKTMYAPLGVTLPNGLTLEPKKIRGVLSEGMLCSEEELGFAEESAGIIELPEDAQVGVNALDYYNETKDIILDVDNKSLTHRPDLWGHFGLAREFAAVFETELKDPYNKEWEQKVLSKITGETSPLVPVVDKDSSCLSYYGLSVDGVSVGESPEWMRKRLKAVGLRPINSIVDISNYVMLELGMPNHIFDREEIKGALTIKNLGSKAEFVTLDEEKRNLVEDDTVICDENGVLCLAGIMGGLNSGVTDKTTKLFLEVANWKAAEVRRTSTRLGLRSDSSQRYEKTLDSKLCKRTLLRMVELILELNPSATVVGKVEYDGVDLDAIETVNVKTSVARVCKHLGKELSEDKILFILSNLDFKVEKKNDELLITVPSYRSTKDIECEADIFEEVGRIIGYDNIEPQSPKLDINPVRLTPAQNLHRSIRDFMVYNANSFEVMTYPMVGEKLYSKANWPIENNLELINSLSRDTDLMRTSMVPSFLEACAVNAKNFSEFRFFELGRTYHANEKDFSNESSKLAILFYSKEKTPFMELVNTVESLMDSQNIPGDLCEAHPKFKNEIINEDWSGVHPYEFLNIRLMGKMKGVITSIHPLVLRNFKVKGHVSLAILDLTPLEARELKDKTKYKPLSKFPSSNFDCTVVVSNEVAVGDIVSISKKAKIKELSSFQVVDTFQLSDSEKAVTVRATFSDPNQTLSGDFITSASDKIVQSLEKAGYPLKK
ncbi:phenylalanine--tRNA ligase subunit beta [Halobacteriovorax sp. GB3]|uniref:phenylalanine--tRNA ligase subunit beta n=1 Tax=Halobacteriovorax sp. GB3 TaxID=2719615 RepID=UPI002362D803|nr:phenylalanine--tRNA ligase subunit beta [Halobacteriovorax sp. GB3]MDD0852390.1 phenylalanine--tRNA ligase subunit beta [Halobacteriovorax sp. GB3]